jgi:GrpB-like predicted nucleotidyltransferase (UPF0157 family)
MSENVVKPPVVIVSYNPNWPQIYEKEKALVLKILRENTLAIEHVGSTSVPGLGAKDIVDMVVGVNDRQAAEDCLILLEPIGYTEVTPEPGRTEWFYCLGKTPGVFPRFHLHLMKYPSTFFSRHILFRDYLRIHPEIADEYCELKKRLAAEYGSDREGYTNAKTEFVESVLMKANQLGPP